MEGAHDAAVAEGSAEVHEQMASRVRQRGQAAAEVALAVARGERRDRRGRSSRRTGPAEGGGRGIPARSAEMMRAEHEATRAMVTALAEEIAAGPRAG